MEVHDGAAVDHEAHLALERAVEPLGEVIERLCEELACERDVVQFFEYRDWRKCHQVELGGIAHYFGEYERDEAREMRQKVVMEKFEKGFK